MLQVPFPISFYGLKVNWAVIFAHVRRNAVRYIGLKLSSCPRAPTKQAPFASFHSIINHRMSHSFFLSGKRISSRCHSLLSSFVKSETLAAITIGHYPGLACWGPPMGAGCISMFEKLFKGERPVTEWKASQPASRPTSHRIIPMPRHSNVKKALDRTFYAFGSIERPNRLTRGVVGAIKCQARTVDQRGVRLSPHGIDVTFLILTIDLK